MTESKSVALPLGYTPISFVHMPTDQEHMFQYTIPFRKSQAFFQFGETVRQVNCRDYAPPQVEAWAAGEADLLTRDSWFQRLFFSQFF